MLLKKNVKIGPHWSIEYFILLLTGILNACHESKNERKRHANQNENAYVDVQADYFQRNG